ncbi:MAG: exodeoxyribonuclease III [Gammaproteobacteria bacterium]|jgi:exodeoxyribonuclease-3|nr:exodeoxyribonuclease III [Gammaproteobacteria bacterium]MBT6044061.1 exodeoxyribonuclease III [Gammaproteobacteria bacterium]
MRLLSWNVNGIRAAVAKGFVPLIQELNCDVICLQETKAQDDQVITALEELKGFHIFPNSAVKKGYSGTAILTSIEPVSVSCDLGLEEHDQEGRVICAQYPDFFLVTVYTPNSGNGLRRLEYRQQWDKEFLSYLKNLEQSKPVIICGDLNVAHKDIDLARPKPNYNKTAGYTQKEIDGLDNLIAANFIDTFRYLHPETAKYTWWSYRAGAREKNVGWRIDYFLSSASLCDKIIKAEIHNQIQGSDHCPVLLELSD